jgi:hypothetical protein
MTDAVNPEDTEATEEYAGHDPATAALITRRDAIAGLVRDSGQGLAFLALGSAAETGRLDRWSDLDFFAIVEPGSKARFVDQLDWLAGAAPIAWCYRNTVDGWKALFEDGILVEFAIFEPDELAGIPFAPGVVLWHRPGFDISLCQPQSKPPQAPPGRDWLAGEILSCLFIGLSRWRRGERTAGFRMIQVHAVDHLLDLMGQTDPGDPAVVPDPFNPTRRLEFRWPRASHMVANLMPGLDQCPAAARSILAELSRRHPIPAPIQDAILNLIMPAE